MRLNPSYKRLRYNEWRDWQKEEYVGIHESRNWTPADDAVGYKFHPCFVVQTPPVDQRYYATPQVDVRMGAQKKPGVLAWLKQFFATV